MFRRTFLFTIPFALSHIVGCASQTTKNSVQNKGDLRPMQPIYLPPENNAQNAKVKEQSVAHVLVGMWVEPIPGQYDKEQGFNLFANGTAKSINMATLVYQGWKLEGSTLILWGKSIGNHATVSFDEKWQVIMVSKKKLVLKKDTIYKTFRKIESI